MARILFNGIRAFFGQDSAVSVIALGAGANGLPLLPAFQVLADCAGEPVRARIVTVGRRNSSLAHPRVQRVSACDTVERQQVGNSQTSRLIHVNGRSFGFHATAIAPLFWRPR